MRVTVRQVAARDVDAWALLYAGYRAFYHLADDTEAVERTWQWVLDGAHGLVGLVATEDEDRPVALANLRWFARPSTATMGLYLDDLFTAPAARGSGAASALLKHAAQVAMAGAVSCGGLRRPTTLRRGRCTTRMP